MFLFIYLFLETAQYARDAVARYLFLKKTSEDMGGCPKMMSRGQLIISIKLINLRLVVTMVFIS
jgi:hypothetical protein